MGCGNKRVEQGYAVKTGTKGSGTEPTRHCLCACACHKQRNVRFTSPSSTSPLSVTALANNEFLKIFITLGIRRRIDSTDDRMTSKYLYLMRMSFGSIANLTNVRL